MKGIEKLVRRAGETLGYRQDVKAVLYKVLLYETDGHFLPHKDTEKEKGMFGTLVVQLPSIYTGGEMIVRFGSTTSTYDFGQSTGSF